MLKKKYNLLLKEYIDKYTNKNIAIIVIVYAIVAFVVCMSIYINNLNMHNKVYALQERTSKYTNANNQLTAMYNSVTEKNNEILSLSKKHFNFTGFMNVLYKEKPDDLEIISVDNDNIIKNIEIEKNKEANGENGEEAVKEEIPKVSEETSNSASEKSQYVTSEDGIEVDNTNTNAEQSQEEEQNLKDEYATLNYERDLLGQTVRIRGYADNSDLIASYINRLSSKVEFVENIDILGIKENKLDNGKDVALFELVVHLRGGDNNE